MKIGIIAAMEEELELLLKNLEDCKEIHFGKFKYYTGQINNVEVAMLLCGIGKVNAAVGATLLIDKLEPDYLINTGVAGGFPEEVKIGDIVISSEVRHHDADATAFDYEFGQIPRMPAAFEADKELVEYAGKVDLQNDKIKVFQGPILSGDSFIHHPEQIDTIIERFPNIMAAEMEGAAIAQTSYLFNIPFVLIRSISDKVKELGSTDIYKKFMEKAAVNSVKLVLELINKLKEKH
ncbi:MAG: 5'-methylthioadenosine/adenosylhomocysteine nucleosidase [Rhodothermaceae bacterium]